MDPNTAMEVGPALEPEQPQPTEEQWLQYKALIQRQFLMCDMSLEGLVHLLSILGLPTTKARLEYRLKKWGISKKIDKRAWQSIDRRITKRKHEGKDSEVIYCGKRLKQSTIKKATSRHRETNIFNQIAQRRSPPPSPTNPYLVVCTPPPVQMEFEWPSSLPWLNFQDTYQKLAGNLPRLNNFHTAPMAIPRTMQINLLTPSVKNISQQVQGISALACISKLAADIGKTMPEWHPGEHLQTAQAILQSSGKESIPHCLKMIIYQVSNGLQTFCACDEWAEFHDLLIGIGILDLRIDLKRHQDHDTTIRAFMERLFQTAIFWEMVPKATSAQSLDLIKWLLISGQDPNTGPMILNSYGENATPLEAAADIGHVELVELLLHFHANVDRPSFLIQSVMISRYPDAIKLRIIKILFQHGNSIELEEILHAAIHLRDLDFVGEVLKLDVDLTKTVAIGPDDSYDSCHPIHQDTALSAAIVAGDDFINLILHQLSVRDPSEWSAPFVTADVFIAAARKGDDHTIRRLHEISPIGFLRNRRGITPLQVAVSYGRLSTCKLLLYLYNRLSPSLLFLAALLGHEEILRFLIRKGADVNATIDWDDCRESARHCPSLVKLFGIRPSPTVLEMLLHAMKGRGDEACLQTPQSNCLTFLIKKGAPLPVGTVHLFARKWLVKPLLAVLAAGGNQDKQNRPEQSALQCAMHGSRDSERYPSVAQQRFETVKALLEHGAKLLGGEVVLAIRFQDQKLFTLLLSHHASLKDSDDAGVSTLEAAIAFRDQYVLQQVLGAYDGHYDPGSLCAAIQAGHLSLVDLLLSNRPSQADCQVLEGTAVGLAAKSGDLNLLRKLFHHLPNVWGLNSVLLYSPPPFWHTLDVGFAGTNDLLFWRHSWLDYRSHYECVEGSPLALAALGTNTAGFRELLSKGCRADILTWTAIAWSQNIQCLGLLGEYQQRLDDLPPSPHTRTPLQTAIKRQNKELVQSLLSAGADVNEYDYSKNDRSPFQLSVELGNLEIVSFLLEKGADVNAPPAFRGGATALQLAAIRGDLGLARHLLNYGARVNARGARVNGRTALEGAAAYGRVDMLGLLIHHKALTTGNGRRQFVRAVKLATKNGYHAAAEMLRRSRGWTQEDEDLFTDAHLFDIDGEYVDFGCCDEIHGSEAECIRDFSEN
ncbi:hypothetical protein ACJZ2D_000267 [Fusarium nematophilum]